AAQESGLATPRRTNERNHLILIDVEIDAMNRFVRSVIHLHILGAHLHRRGRTGGIPRHLTQGLRLPIMHGSSLHGYLHLHTHHLVSNRLRSQMASAFMLNISASSTMIAAEVLASKKLRSSLPCHK